MGSPRADAGSAQVHEARRDGARCQPRSRRRRLHGHDYSPGLGRHRNPHRLGRNLPPDWGCIPKQPDSQTAPRGATGSGHDGLSPSRAPLSRGLGPGPPLRTLLQTTIRTPEALDSQPGLFPVRSPLLGESFRALSLVASGATCVQRLDGSRDSAIHTKYRISLRSSSMREPRYPLPRVVLTYRIRRSAPDAHHLWAAGAMLDSFEFLGAVCAGFGCAAGKAAAAASPAKPESHAPPPGGLGWPLAPRLYFTGSRVVLLCRVSTMILPQVHLRKPCYDFSFL
ncbi:hypothetical protein FNV43_RR20611 [Rhamnella rubrinervis]|uniref:Uncharacterized protein n=1 Tax=Rhamnella rubrinervis TaxID=2594499 RepID=A0A8K0DV46_9ROSA|nr:hypothetical protein FNV43_RR20611 [Rhamnella rubrinervis]